MGIPLKKILAILILLFLLFLNHNSKNNLSSKIQNNTVVRVIDGDTFALATGEKIRLICIDAPELGTKHSKEAKQFLENLILNKTVRLEKDISETDKYNRLLRYVWVNNTANQEIFVNREIVREDYAKIFAYEQYTKRCDEIQGFF